MTINRRALIFGSLATCFPKIALAKKDPYQRLNGYWDPDAKLFHWGKINVDRYGDQPLQRALYLFGIPHRNQRKILKAIEVGPGVYTNPTEGVQVIKEGHMYAAMASGGVRTPKAWAAPNVVPHPNSSWISTKIDVWKIRVGSKRYIIGRPHGCNNWVIMAGTNAPFECWWPS